MSGVDGHTAYLLGPVADNAVFLLSGGVVGRVASSAAQAERALRELRVARWLVEQGVPAAQPLESVDQPVVAAGRVVTFWHEIHGATVASTAELGAALKRLHAVTEPAGDWLGLMEPFVRLTDHLATAASHLAAPDMTFLSEQLRSLRSAFPQVRFVRPHGVIHGDANRKNCLRDGAGSVLLIDLERFSLGPREWDLVVAAVYRRLGWYTEDEYRAFTNAYGWDVTEWHGYPVLAAIRELRMTLWLAARAGREPRLIPEAQHRIATLRDPTAPRSWKPGV